MYTYHLIYILYMLYVHVYTALGERAKLLSQLSEHFPEAHQAAAPHQPPTATGGDAPADHVRFGGFLAPQGRPQHPELVPSVDFVGIDRHLRLLEELSKATRRGFLELKGAWNRGEKGGKRS